MKKIIPHEQLRQTVEEFFAAGGENFPLTVTGHSMTPFLVSGRDTVFLSPASDGYAAGDIVAFTRPGGAPIVHRVIRAENGVLTVAGDYQDYAETVPAEQVFAVCRSVVRKGKPVNEHDPLWRFFATFWVRSFGHRKQMLTAYARFRR